MIKKKGIKSPLDLAEEKALVGVKCRFAKKAIRQAFEKRRKELMKKNRISIPEKLAELSKNCDFFWGFHPTSDCMVISFPRIQVHLPNQDLKDPYLDTFGLYQQVIFEARTRMEMQFSNLKTVLDKLVED